MTVKLLMDWPDSRDGKQYIASNLLTTDAGTESGLVAAKMATSTLAGGTAYVSSVAQTQYLPVMASTNLTGGIVLSAAGIEISLNAPYQSAIPVISPLNASNNVLLGATIKGGSIGKNGRLQIRMMWSYLNNANAKSIKIRFGGASYAYNAGLASQASANIVVDIMNRGMTNSQIMTPVNVGGTLSGMAQPFGLSNVDTTIDQLLTIECQKAVGTDTAVLEAVFIEVKK